MKQNWLWRCEILLSMCLIQWNYYVKVVIFCIVLEYNKVLDIHRSLNVELECLEQSFYCVYACYSDD